MANSLTLTWSPYIVWNPCEVYIEQGNPWQWIQFHIDKQIIPYCLETVFPHKKMWARMNMVTDKTSKESARILVPEHIVSLLVMLSLEALWWFCPDVSIHIPQSNKILWWKDTFVPVLWPWIWCHDLDSLRDLIKNAISLRNKVWVFHTEKALVNRNIWHYSDKFAEGSLGESTWCLANITSHTQYDIVGTLHTTSHPAKVDYSDVDTQHYAARAMWRLPGRSIYHALQLAHQLWLFNWITTENYFIAWPWNDEETIRSKMARKYQKWFSEHMYHTLYADLPGELAALAASLGVDWFHVSLSMKDMTHFDRLGRFKQLKRDNVLTYRNF